MTLAPQRRHTWTMFAAIVFTPSCDAPPRDTAAAPTSVIAVGDTFSGFVYESGDSGGARRASDFGAHCVGWVPDQPGHRLNLATTIPYLRVIAEGGFTAPGVPSNLTLVIVAEDGTVRCGDDYADGPEPVVDGTFPAGTYDIYVGEHSRHARGRYSLVGTTSPSITPRNMTYALWASRPGSVLRQGRFSVRTAAGLPIEPGARCEFSQVSVGPSDRGGDFRWSVRCGARVLYEAIAPAFDESWPENTRAYDVATSAQDGTPSFVWSGARIEIREDASGPSGPFDVQFTVLPLMERAP